MWKFSVPPSTPTRLPVPVREIEIPVISYSVVLLISILKLFQSQIAAPLYCSQPLGSPSKTLDGTVISTGEFSSSAYDIFTIEALNTPKKNANRKAVNRIILLFLFLKNFTLNDLSYIM